MAPLLFLVHRIPYPPNKGDKIRSFNILAHLSKRYEVHLGAFVDAPEDREFADALASYCVEVHLCHLQPRWKRVRSLSAMITGGPLSVRYFFDARMKQWVDDVIGRHRVETVFIYSSTMAQYVMPRPAQCLRVVCDMVDVDSEKWQQYAARRSGPARYVFQREARTLAAFEARVAAACDATTFVSRQEAAVFGQRHPQLGARVSSFRNGVDVEFFDPALDYDNPFPAGTRPIVFTGAMDYWANIDAVSWYVDAVHARVCAEEPTATFFIVGSNPSKAVLKLGDKPNVVVTGRVADIRPYVARAACVIAPLRIARGLQNKVLEAMAMNKRIVATADALEGIDAASCEAINVCNDTNAFASAVVGALTLDAESESATRPFIIDQFSWTANLAALDDALTAPEH